MNKILAWFITFNFINITWIFFRAKDFESAIKVLGSMFSLDNVVLSKKLIFVDIGAKFNDIVILTIVVFIIVLAFKNSMNNLNSNFKANYFNLVLFIIYFTYSVISMSNISEFLYFNF